MKIDEILQSLIVNEPNSNIAYWVQDREIEKYIQDIAKERFSESIDISEYDFRRFPFIGEYFESAIIQNDEVVLNPIFAKELGRVVQKNRITILITKLDLEKVQNVYEPLNFTDFNMVEKDILVMKRWFKW